MSKEKVPYVWWFLEDRFLTEKTCCLEILSFIAKQIVVWKYKGNLCASKKY